jgi:hypothetical protein
MSSKEYTSLDQARSIAQYFTMSVAVLYAIFWIIDTTFRTTSSVIDLIEGILFLSVVAGGMAMGILYAIYLARTKRVS